MEDIGQYLVKRQTEIFVCLRLLVKLKYSIFNNNIVIVLYCIEMKPSYIAKLVEIDWLELIKKIQIISS